MNKLTFIKKTHYIEADDSYVWLWCESTPEPETYRLIHTFNPGDIITLSSLNSDEHCWVFESDGGNVALCQQEISSQFFNPKDIFSFILANGTLPNIEAYDKKR